MRVYLTRRYRFSAAHRLDNPAMSADQNRETYGKCNNPFGHGHNYGLEVTVSGPVDARTGMVCDLGELDRFVATAVLERYDHVNLNSLPEFREQVPTTENLCAHIYEIVQRGFAAAHLDTVRIEETGNNSFAYAGGAEVRH